MSGATAEPEPTIPGASPGATADGWTVEIDGGPSAVVRPGEEITAGRSPRCTLSAPEDRLLSRRQFRVAVGADGRATVADLTDGRSPLFADGEQVCGSIMPDAPARLAAGRTRFRLTPPAAHDDDAGTVFPGADWQIGDGTAYTGTLTEGALTFDARALAAVPVTRPDRRFEAVARLPEVLNSPDDARRLPALCGLLLAGVQDAEAVAALDWNPERGAEVREWAGRNELTGAPAVPTDLVAAALTGGEAALAPAGDGWAFVVPIPESDRPGAARRGLLVRGTTTAAPAERAADVRFAALVAEIVAAADRSGRLERQAAALRPFLPPRVLAALGDSPDPAALAPAECVASVLFCDLRGFSRTSEELSDDLPALLERVSAALTVMTRHIRDAGGVTGDFLGDAALAFWGWPQADPEAPIKAATAAVRIAADFAADRPAGDPLAGFRVGVGVATGPAVAGRIGTEDQAKITVFGPTANLASRLEGLCGPLRVPVVCDDATARAVANSGILRVRPLGTLRPAKMNRAERVSELLPPADRSPLTDADVARYAEAVAAFTAGDWPRAAELLQDHPAADLAQDFLRMRLAEHHRTAPPGWDGVVRVDAK